MESIKLCGVVHNIIFDDVVEEGVEGIVLGRINNSRCEIHIKKGLTEELEKETIIHEMIHGILDHLGKWELSNDEGFVQLLTHGIYEHFDIREDIIS